MTAHPELSETPDTKWPGVYCPSNPDSYRLLFDVYDEYIDLLKPKWVHAGHDELFQPVGLCPRCKDKDIGERFGEDVRIIHDYLASKGVSMIIWGDRLLEGVSGKGLHTQTAPDGFTYQVAGGNDSGAGEPPHPKGRADLQLVLVDVRYRRRHFTNGLERRSGRRF